MSGPPPIERSLTIVVLFGVGALALLPLLAGILACGFLIGAGTGV